MIKKAMSPEQVGRMWQIKQELNGLCTIWHGLEACALDIVEELENDFMEAGIPLTPEVKSGFDLMQRLLVGVTPARDVRAR